MYFRIRWPDDTGESFYSPSTIITSFFVPGGAYALPEFVVLARTALHAASDRVRQVYGMPCSRAAASLHAIETRAAAFQDGQVTFVSFEPDAVS
jgi:uncharacterized repeat protein (TIGR04042 family)